MCVFYQFLALAVAKNCSLDLESFPVIVFIEPNFPLTKCLIPLSFCKFSHLGPQQT